MSIRIDKEFESLIPPLTDEEFKQLEENIVREGIRDPLVVWHVPNGDDILIDGHNRWKIAAKHAGIPFDIKRMEFKSHDDVKLWIIDNQLGKRNLDLYDKVLLQDQKKHILAEQAKKKQGERTDLSDIPKKSWESETEKRRALRENETDYKIAKSAGTSEDTVRKIRAIDKQAAPETKQLIREGRLSINQAYNSLRPKQQDPVKQAKQEHEEFQTKKGDGIVNFKDVQIDKINQDIIGNSLLQEVLKLINEVDKFAMIHKTEELKTLTTAVKDDERGIIADKCKTGRMTLQIIENYIRGI